MNRRVLALAKKELTDAIRSWTLWGAITALVLLASSAILSMYLEAPSPASLGNVSANVILHLFQFTPVVALLIGYKAIIGEQESGSLRYLLSHPISRTEIMLGKILGRSVVFVLSLVVAVALLVATSITLYGGIAVFDLVVHTAFLLFYGAVWLAIGLGVSAVARSRFQAVSSVFGIYVVTHFFWQRNILPLLTYAFAGDASSSHLRPISLADGPTWYLYVQRLNPVKTFQAGRGVLIELLDSEPANVDAAVSYPLNVDANLFGVVLLLLWAVVPLGIGYWRFTRAELD